MRIHICLGKIGKKIKNKNTYTSNKIKSWYIHSVENAETK